MFPELVAGDGDEHYKAVDYSGLTSVLTEAIKALLVNTLGCERRLALLERALAGALLDGGR